MKVSDYIVSFLIEKRITDVFGYPGGMVTHLMDSFEKKQHQIKAHVTYHEQGAAFCACGYAQTKKLPGIAYATSGPGATNLITGIANAYFDSIPCIFITGQVNTYEGKKDLKIRQKGFQEMDVVQIVAPITKYAVQITTPEQIPYQLEKAYTIAMEKRPGPVVLDMPMDIQRSQIDLNQVPKYQPEPQPTIDYETIKNEILEKLQTATRPLILAGGGIQTTESKQEFQQLVKQLNIPVVTSMIARDLLDSENENQLGFIGAYGHRCANIAISKSDCILSLGSRLDCRQTGAKKEDFAEHAQILRIDIDKNETANPIKPNEIAYHCELKQILNTLLTAPNIEMDQKHHKWRQTCQTLKQSLSGIDEQEPNRYIKAISRIIPDQTVITTDVGQNQVWVAQNFKAKKNQRILYSGGHGAMGYALPAAIGAYYANKQPVICFCGDGGLQMNIQEMQFLAREQLPIKIILLNNQSLGMIRHFQEMYFEENYTQTTAQKGYQTPDFIKIAEAYGISAYRINKLDQIEQMEEIIKNDLPVLIEINCGEKTYVYPKLAYNRPIYDQEPLMDREELKKILSN